MLKKRTTPENEIVNSHSISTKLPMLASTTWAINTIGNTTKMLYY
jgi:hypothetical protein